MVNTVQFLRYTAGADWVSRRTPLKTLLETQAHPVRRAHHAPSADLEHMRIDPGRVDIRVPQQLLHGPNVSAFLKHMGGSCGAANGSSRPW